MPRHPRVAAGGYVYHVLNRAAGRRTLFTSDEDYQMFERTLIEACERTGMRVLAWCLMPDHWHLVIWPRKEGDLSAFMRWLSIAHTRRWHVTRGAKGRGKLYRERYRSLPVQSDEHVAQICRYVERNPVRAGLVRQAKQWRWSSLRWRTQRPDEAGWMLPPDRWPGKVKNWPEFVAQTENGELEALRKSVTRSSPFGDPKWQQATARRLGMEYTLRPRGRPRKNPLPAEKAKKTAAGK